MQEFFKGALLSFLSDPSFGATFLAIFSAFEIIVGLALILVYSLDSSASSQEEWRYL